MNFPNLYCPICKKRRHGHDEMARCWLNHRLMAGEPVWCPCGHGKKQSTWLPPTPIGPLVRFMLPYISRHWEALGIKHAADLERHAVESALAGEDNT